MKIYEEENLSSHKYINGRYDHRPQDLNCGVPISTRFTTPSACAL